MEDNVITNARQAFQQAVNPPQPPVTTSEKRLQKVLMSSVGQAFVGGLFVMAFLWILNPPMVQSKKNSDIEHARKDMRKILIYSGVTVVLILVLPKLYQRCQKSFKS
jgi:hypothetical protein